MSLRTPNSTINLNMILDLQRTKARIGVLTEQIATGKRINRPGDDPTGSAVILDLQNSIDRNSAYIQQSESALNFLSRSELGAQSLIDSITRLFELSAQALTGPQTAASRAAAAPEVDAIRSSIISIGNTQAQGKYIFAGTATLTAPFTGPSAGPIAYGGDGGLISMDVSAGYSVTTNVLGSTLFFGPGGQGSATDLFQAVTDLRDGLNANNTALIQTASTNLDAIFARVNQTIADLGGRQAGLIDLQNTLESANLGLESVLTSTEQIDYPSVATEFSVAETTQQATLSTLAKVNLKNLFDYLG